MNSISEKLGIRSIWSWEHYRDDVLIDTWIEKNIITNEGINDFLDVHLSGGTQKTTWYVGIFNTNTTPTSILTYATPGFTESTHYDEATRPQWQEAGPSSKSITNSANKATFTAATSESIYGGFLVGGGSAATTKGDTAGGGKLLLVSKFSSTKNVDPDDVLKITITISGADA